MKKIFTRLLQAIVLLAILLAIVLFIGWLKAPHMISKELSKALQVSVEIGSITPSFRQITIKHIEIANLPGNHLSKALSIETCCSRTPFLNYLKQHILIDQITLDDVYLGLEFDSPKSAKGNWTTLMDNLQSNVQTPSKSKDIKTVQIKELVLTNIQVDVFYKSSRGRTKRLPVIPKIVLKNINTAEGFPIEQITKSVLGQMLQSIFVQENLKNMFEMLEPQNAFDTLLQPFKAIF